MTQCVQVKLKHRKICLGDLNKKILLYTRSITAPDESAEDNDQVDFGESFTKPKTIWAGIETRTGREIFDGTNLLGVATHYFYVRYRAGLTSENWIKFNGEYYDILRVENWEERNEFMLLYSSVRGDSLLKGNMA